MNTIDKLRQKNTDDFLRSFGIQKKMSSVSGFDEDMEMSTAHKVELHPQNPFDSDLQCGQIRLLSQTSRITYVVLLRRQENGSFLVMAFSHYDFPASDKEFKPRFDGGMYLNVLQAWNTGTFQEDFLKKSWLIGVLPDADCSDALGFVEHLAAGRPLKPELAEKTGMPVAASDDPRIQYFLEEKLPVSFQPANAERSLRKPIDWVNRIAVPELGFEAEPALAAGDEKRNFTAECTPSGHDEFVSIVFSPREKVLRVNIYTPDQSGTSHTFDSWDLISQDCTVLASIRDGFCTVHGLEAFDGKCALRNPADHTVVVFEKREK